MPRPQPQRRSHASCSDQLVVAAVAATIVVVPLVVYLKVVPLDNELFGFWNGQRANFDFFSSQIAHRHRPGVAGVGITSRAHRRCTRVRWTRHRAAIPHASAMGRPGCVGRRTRADARCRRHCGWWTHTRAGGLHGVRPPSALLEDRGQRSATPHRDRPHRSDGDSPEDAERRAARSPEASNLSIFDGSVYSR